jgi:hypothetical protein
LPASILLALIAKVYDPFVILYSYRVKPRFMRPLALSAQHEVWMYILALVSIFSPELLDELLTNKVA